MNAPAVIVAIAVKQVRGVTTYGKDKAKNAVLTFKTFQYAHLAIHHAPDFTIYYM